MNCNNFTFRFFSSSGFIDMTQIFARPEPHHFASYCTPIQQFLIERPTKSNPIIPHFPVPPNKIANAPHHSIHSSISESLANPLNVRFDSVFLSSLNRDCLHWDQVPSGNHGHRPSELRGPKPATV